MSTEYYLVCHECKKKAHVGCFGMSGVQFWSGEKDAMEKANKILNDCVIFHTDKLGFVREQSDEDEEYREVKNDK